MASPVACLPVGVLIVSWGLAERSLLKRARKAHGHSQEQCAVWLSEHGADVSPDQPSVSKWECGVNVPSGARLNAITAYIDEVSEIVAPEPAVGPSSRGGEPLDEDVFQEMVRGLAGQRLLSDEQLAHIRALNERLQKGPEMSPSDDVVQLRVARYLGLEPG